MTAPLPGGRAPIVVVSEDAPILSGFGSSGAGYLRVGEPGDDAGVVLLLTDRAAVKRLADELTDLSQRMGVFARARAASGVASDRMPPRLRAVPRG